MGTVSKIATFNEEDFMCGSVLRLRVVCVYGGCVWKAPEVR